MDAGEERINWPMTSREVYFFGNACAFSSWKAVSVPTSVIGGLGAPWRPAILFIFLFFNIWGSGEQTQKCTYHAPGYPHTPPPPPPPPPRRWWGFHQDGWSNLSENPTPGTKEMVKQTPPPPPGRQRPVCLYDSVLWISQGNTRSRRSAEQTDNGQCASVPRNPPHSQTPHPR